MRGWHLWGGVTFRRGGLETVNIPDRIVSKHCHEVAAAVCRTGRMRLFCVNDDKGFALGQYMTRNQKWFALILCLEVGILGAKASMLTAQSSLYREFSSGAVSSCRWRGKLIATWWRPAVSIHAVDLINKIPTKPSLGFPVLSRAWPAQPGSHMALAKLEGPGKWSP